MLIIAITAPVGSRENGNPIPTQWIIVTVSLVVLVIVFFAVSLVRFRRRKTKKEAGGFLAYDKSKVKKGITNDVLTVILCG